MTGAPRGVVLEGVRRVDPDGTRPGPVRIAGGRISGEPAERGEVVLGLAGHLVFPGLVNAHDHLPLNCFPAPPAGGPFETAAGWIESLKPFLESPAVVATRAVDRSSRARQGGLKNLLAGTTTVAHHDPWLDVFAEETFPVRVPSRYGWCHSLALAGRYGPGLEEGFAATPPGARWFVHLAEGTGEESHAELSSLADAGILGPALVAVHAVGLGADGERRLVEAGGSAVWCPSSNLRILGRTLDPRLLAGEGRLALGTDSRLSGDRDLLDELRSARGASGLDEGSLLALVTRDGGRVLGRPGAGRLEPGDAADLVVVRDGPSDPRGALLPLRRSDLRAVVLGGIPRIVDPDLSGWMEACGVPARRGRVDGVAKLVDERLFPAHAAALEPGLELL